MGAGQGQHGLPVGRARLACRVKPQVAQQVEHDGGRMLARLGQRQAGHGMHLQVKLRNIAGVQRVVAAVVRARGHFIDDQGAVRAAVVDHEKLDAQDANIADVICY